MGYRTWFFVLGGRIQNAVAGNDLTRAEAAQRFQTTEMCVTEWPTFEQLREYESQFPGGRP